MMKIFLLTLLFFFDFLMANTNKETLDLNNFEIRQVVLKKVKKLIQLEEIIAKAYEEYILDNYKLPNSINSLRKDEYLGLNFFENMDNKYFFNFEIKNNYFLIYHLKDELKKDKAIKDFYESNTSRKNTYIKNDKVYMKVEDGFAKHLYYLIRKQNKAILECGLSSARYCKKNNQLFIYDSSGELLFYYHIDNYRKGIKIITDNKLLHTSSEFSMIRDGTLLFDVKGYKYIKIRNSIKSLYE